MTRIDKRTVAVLFACLMIASMFVAVLAVPASAQEDNTTSTPTDSKNSSEGGQDNSTSISKSKLIALAEKNADITKEQAQRFLKWFNDHKSEFSVTEVNKVRSWLTSQLTTESSWSASKVYDMAKNGKEVSSSVAKSIYDWYLNGGNTDLSKKQRGVVSEWLKQEISESPSPSKNSTDGNPNVDAEGLPTANQNQTSLQDAKVAISDGNVSAKELRGEFEPYDVRVGSMHIKFVEWEGSTATIIVRAETPLTYSFTDPNSVKQSGNGKSGTITNKQGTLTSGWHVIEMQTVRDAGDEMIWVGVGNQLKYISKPGVPLFATVTFVMLVMGALGGGTGVFGGAVIAYKLLQRKAKRKWHDMIDDYELI